MQIENWTDLRFVLALHRGGTLTGAAALLGVDQTTVTRRLRAIERTAGSELYEQLRGGARFTRIGAELVAAAERVEAEMLELEARIFGGQTHLEGPVRITLPTLLAVALMEDFHRFTERHPGIELEVVAADQVQSLSKREADIAVRAGPAMQVPEHLVGRKVCPLFMSVFGASSVRERPWEQRSWIGWVESHPGWTALTEAYRTRYGNGPLGMKVNSPWAAVEAARAGGGVVALLCGCPPLTRGLVPLTEPEPAGEVWVLTHPELRRSPRIRAALDYLYEVFERRAMAFAGEAQISAEARRPAS